MKKVIVGMMTGAFVISMCAATAFAAGPWCGHHGGCATGSGCAYVDANGDGVCDSCGTYHRVRRAGGGYYFVDANGDGICDNYGLGQGRGCGRGHGCGRGW